MSGGEHIQACAKESLVAEAVARGMLLPEDLRGHAETCPVCSEAALVVQSLGEMFAGDMEDPLPSGTFTWWRLNLRMHLEYCLRALIHRNGLSLIDQFQYSCAIAFTKIGRLGRTHEGKCFLV
jgi:hypothetical protein